MQQKIGYATVVVKDYDEAITFYTQTLGFQLIEDTKLTEKKRWVLVAPKGKPETSLLLAKADSTEQLKFCGNQTGGRVFLFLHTDDFWRDYEEMKAKGVIFHEEPRTEEYGTVAVFEDLYGNKWDLLEMKHSKIFL